MSFVFWIYLLMLGYVSEYCQSIAAIIQSFLNRYQDDSHERQAGLCAISFTPLKLAIVSIEEIRSTHDRLRQLYLAIISQSLVVV